MIQFVGKTLLLACATAFVIFIVEFAVRINQAIVAVEEVQSIALWAFVKALIISVVVMTANRVYASRSTATN